MENPVTIVSILENNDCYKIERSLIVKGIMVHSTGANNPNISRYVPIGATTNHWNKPGITKCVHAFIGKDNDGKVTVCKTLPYDIQGWHAGSPSQPGKFSANVTHIGFECCEDDLTDKVYFWQVYNKAVEYCAYLCALFNLNPITDIISHHEGYLKGIASNHADIDHWLKRYGENMDKFRKRVVEILDKEDKVMDYETFKAYMDQWLKEQDEKPYSDWAVTAGIPDKAEKAGFTDGTRPQGLVTREQAFTMILAALEEGGK